VFATNVIVGTADRRHHTPVFSATMREVVFRPYWDVPPRIARAELVPIFRRTPSRFDEEGFEIVRPGTIELDATTFQPTAHNLSRVAAGELRVRQRPGTANALGFIKFVFPNRYNVFLHDTPTRELFARARRDFSHGCIRVSRPNELAEFVLQGQDTWDRAAIDSMMRGARTLHVALDRPVSVFVVYATAAATSDGTVHFYPDLYKQDAALERALGIAPGTR
jgi:murein L,D-transpeptidase YcbB/YkuD